MSVTLQCPKHKTYTAQRPPTANCWYCRDLYAIRVRYDTDVEFYGMRVTSKQPKEYRGGSDAASDWY